MQISSLSFLVKFFHCECPKVWKREVCVCVCSIKMLTGSSFLPLTANIAWWSKRADCPNEMWGFIFKFLSLNNQLLVPNERNGEKLNLSSLGPRGCLGTHLNVFAVCIEVIEKCTILIFYAELCSMLRAIIHSRLQLTVILVLLVVESSPPSSFHMNIL